ncbi:hypothetical protein E3V39_07840 [Gammaproteobacteria bacterium LSUCC0112]|nr:hypothetical protein E3V39_07840 [Gammaproteobacteria bacterium LSUCC0112]
MVIALKKDQERRHKDMAENNQTLPPITLQEPEPEPVINLEQPLAEETPAQHLDLSWKERCKTLRNLKLYPEALLAAQEGWPQLQSYEQAAVTLRAMIRTCDSTNLEQLNKLLKMLYQAACEASFLYDRPSGQASPGWQTVAQTTTRQDLQQHVFSWQLIGYKELKLLTATDIKKMIQLWGDPDQHLSVRSLADTDQ